MSKGKNVEGHTTIYNTYIMYIALKIYNHSVEELKAAVSSTISEFMKLENSFTNFQLSCATSDIILNLLKVVSI
jgi:hypothetical protein